MGTFTWLTASHSDIGIVPTGALTPLTVTIPAGGIMKRFQVRNNALHGEQDGIGVTAIGPATYGQLVYEGNPFFVGRHLYTSTRGIPSAISALYDPATLQRVYNQVVSVGDEILEINQGCSYFKHTDTFSHEVTYQPTINAGLGGGPFVLTGYDQYQFAVLYETLP